MEKSELASQGSAEAGQGKGAREKRTRLAPVGPGKHALSGIV